MSAPPPPPGPASAHILIMEINFSWEEILLYMTKTHLRDKQILLSITFKFARNRDTGKL